MSVTDYIATFEKNRKEIETIKTDLMQAYLDAKKATAGADGLVDLASLKDTDNRVQFAQNMFNSLDNAVMAYLAGKGMTPAGAVDEHTKAQLIAGRYGDATLRTLRRYIDYVKDRTSDENWLQNMEQYMERARNMFADLPMRKLEIGDAEDVTKATFTHKDDVNFQANPAVKVDHTKLTIEDLDYLLRKYLSRDVITLEDIEDKAYRVP